MNLVVFVGNDKESYGQVNAVINRSDAERIILLKEKSADFSPSREGVRVIEIDCSDGLLELREKMLEKLKKEVNVDFEVALSIASGTGKEHMAVISALLSIPVGVKLVAFTKEGIKFLS